ncbi:MAG TPA: lysylphosphatidylglycerol synthase transmembrane domain-containing protein [Gaiellaceae bacterium]
MIDQLLHALHAFADYLGSLGWAALGAAAGCHVAKIVARTRAWRNILAAAHPRVNVRWRSVFGAYAAGTAVNAVVPARGGDALKLFLARRRIPGSSYPTLVSTLAVETLVDMVVSAGLLLWALQQHALPGLDVLPRLRTVDWSWADRHPRVALVAGVALLVVVLAAAFWARPRLREFMDRVRAGGAILRTPALYLRHVVVWQLLDWALRLATVYWLLRAFGVPSTARNVLLVQVTQNLSTLLPLTPGGIGTEQGLLVYVFSGTAPAAAVLSFSVGMKITLTAVNLALGLPAMAVMLRTLRWRGVSRDAALE